MTHAHTCQNTACGKVFESKEVRRLYCCRACAVAVNVKVRKQTGRRKDVAGKKRGARKYLLSGI